MRLSARLVHQRILHRRIRSDPVFSIPKDAANFNRARVTSPPPTPLHADSKTIPTISYFQTDECGSYGSSYGSRGDVYEQNKETKLTLGHPTAFSANRLSVSSEVTIIDDKDDIQRSSPIPPHDESALSTSSVSPMEQSFMTTTSDQPARGNQFGTVSRSQLRGRKRRLRSTVNRLASQSLNFLLVATAEIDLK